ncbi:hypothetical protein [Paraburkholderia sediminicola]|uniref:hypothetical protein n=1 Tax=Paraburkholderia sediminicola TaxID=458836 RepID=UPI0038B8D937
MLIITASNDCQFEAVFVEFCRPIFRRITQSKPNANPPEPQLRRNAIPSEQNRNLSRNLNRSRSRNATPLHLTATAAAMQRHFHLTATAVAVAMQCHFISPEPEPQRRCSRCDHRGHRDRI